MNNELQISFDDFSKLDIRVGKILDAEIFKEARKPAYKLQIDFGELGVLKSSAQICDLYTPDDLKAMQVVAVVNFPTKQIANFMSECLVLGVPTEKGVVLLNLERRTENGLPIS